MTLLCIESIDGEGDALGCGRRGGTGSETVKQAPNCPIFVQAVTS
jgi:hypothetical protein